jgi:hypothetical protein
MQKYFVNLAAILFPVQFLYVIFPNTLSLCDCFLFYYFLQMVPRNEENGNFAKLKYAGDGYKEINKYIATQPLDARKNGFGSKDAFKRDEFANSIATAQYRESIKKESFFNNVDADRLKGKMTTMLAERAAFEETQRNTIVATTGFSYSNKVPQFDIGRSRVTEFNPKATRDTYYVFDDERDKRFGATSKPASYEIGNVAWEVTYKPPSFGGKSEVKNFQDKSHLTIKQGGKG